MRREEKAQIIEAIAAQLEQTPDFYVTDIAGLNAEQTSELRRACFEKDIKLVVVKNTLLSKVIEKGSAEAASLIPTLEGPTAVMFTTTPNGPAKLIKEFESDEEIVFACAASVLVVTQPQDHTCIVDDRKKNKNGDIVDYYKECVLVITNIIHPHLDRDLDSRILFAGYNYSAGKIILRCCPLRFFCDLIKTSTYQSKLCYITFDFSFTKISLPVFREKDEVYAKVIKAIGEHAEKKPLSKAWISALSEMIREARDEL